MTGAAVSTTLETIVHERQGWKRVEAVPTDAMGAVVAVLHTIKIIADQFVQTEALMGRIAFFSNVNWEKENEINEVQLR